MKSAESLPGAPEKLQADLQAKVNFLKQATSYREGVTNVAAVETHMSWVFLTDQYVYKLKKPVKYNFLDFSTLSLRHNNCMEEIRLNKRLSPHIYEGVVPLIQLADGNLKLNGRGKVVDWLVQMRRLPAERVLTRLIEKNEVYPEHIHDLAGVLCDFYKKCIPIEITPALYLKRLRKQVHDTYRELLSYNFSSQQIIRLHSWQLNVLQDNTSLFEERVRHGKIVEGHGDLRPEHIFINHPPVIIDCLEFNKIFRILDIAEELSYLFVECCMWHAPWIGEMIIEYYAHTLQDNVPAILVRFYIVKRAFLRALLSLRHLNEQLSARINASRALVLGKGWTAELSGWLNTPRRNTFIHHPWLGTVDAGIQKTVNARLKARLSMQDLFHTNRIIGDVHTPGFNRDFRITLNTRIAMLNLTYTFGNEQLKGARQRKTGSEDELQRTKE